MTELSTVDATVEDLPTIPRGRAAVFELPTGLADLAEQGPIHRLRYADGHVGWIVTDFDLCRKVLMQPEFSSRPDLRHSAIHEAIGDGQPPEERPGMFVGMDQPEHTHYRRIVAAALKLGEMRKLRADITARAEALFDQCAGGTADLVDGVASPLPALVITGLLGVEESVSHTLTACLHRMLSLDSTADEVREMFGTIFDELGAVVMRRQADHAPGFITNMIEDGRAGPRRDDQRRLPARHRWSRDDHEHDRVAATCTCCRTRSPRRPSAATSERSPTPWRSSSASSRSSSTASPGRR